MGRPSDAKERLFQSAGELIHEKGYNAVGISEICARAQVHKGSFYHFFPSKQQLVLDLIDRSWLDSRAFLESTLIGPGPPLERLRAYFASLRDHHACARSRGGRQTGCFLGNLALEMSTQDPLLRDRLRQTFEAQIGYFERLLREARERGEVPPDLDCRQSAEALFAYIEGQVLLMKVRNDLAVLGGMENMALRLVAGRTKND